MKVTVSLCDESGRMWTGEANLVKSAENGQESTGSGVDFQLGDRAFAKRTCEGRSGPAIFTLLAAYLAKGDRLKEVALPEIATLWNRMTQVLGMEFNRKYPTIARERGWVDSLARGMYKLTATWMGAAK